jgi:alkanesulfonate monooxygenase SsuD/methylene tetrahydromethanopterin reductase-like flavin-dependent oxidoreductase (luciferase family)
MSLVMGAGVLPIAPIAYADELVRDAEESGPHSVLVADHLMAWFAGALWADAGNIAILAPGPHVFMDPVAV